MYKYLDAVSDAGTTFHFKGQNGMHGLYLGPGLALILGRHTYVGDKLLVRNVLCVKLSVKM